MLMEFLGVLNIEDLSEGYFSCILNLPAWYTHFFWKNNFQNFGAYYTQILLFDMCLLIGIQWQKQKEDCNKLSCNWSLLT